MRAPLALLGGGPLGMGQSLPLLQGKPCWGDTGHVESTASVTTLSGGLQEEVKGKPIKTHPEEQGNSM